MNTIMAVFAVLILSGFVALLGLAVFEAVGCFYSQRKKSAPAKPIKDPSNRPGEIFLGSTELKNTYAENVFLCGSGRTLLTGAYLYNCSLKNVTLIHSRLVCCTFQGGVELGPDCLVEGKESLFNEL